MKKYLAKSNTEFKDDQYAMYIGRFQPMHDGHKWLFEQSLQEGKRVLICVRDMPTDEKNPFTTEDVIEMLTKEFQDQVNSGMVKIMAIPNIGSINIGRGVGYDVIEHVPPDDISKISATQIRAQMNESIAKKTPL